MKSVSIIARLLIKLIHSMVFYEELIVIQLTESGLAIAACKLDPRSRNEVVACSFVSSVPLIPPRWWYSSAICGVETLGCISAALFSISETTSSKLWKLNVTTYSSITMQLSSSILCSPLDVPLLLPSRYLSDHFTVQTSDVHGLSRHCELSPGSSRDVCLLQLERHPAQVSSLRVALDPGRYQDS